MAPPGTRQPQRAARSLAVAASSSAPVPGCSATQAALRCVRASSIAEVRTIWFTAAPGGDGTPVTVANVPSNGTTLLVTIPAGAQPGDIVTTEPAFVVCTGDGALQFVDVQPEGKPRMAANDWLRGRGARSGDRLA